MTEQWNPETTDRGWHWLRRRDNLEWRLAFCDRVGSGWRASDVIGRTAAMSSGKVGRLFTYHGPVRRHDEPRTSKTIPKTKADLRELMRADRRVLNKSQGEQGVVDREAAGEVVPAVRIERGSRRRPRGGA